MKLPISLVVLAVLSQASAHSDGKESDTKPKDPNQTNKRELQEGNFGDRKTKELLPKFATNEASPKPEYDEKSLKELIAEQSPEQQVFGVRLPPISKISDVLSGHGSSFEAALAKHLYSPVSVYHTRLQSPTSFEVPEAAASQLGYPQTYQANQADSNYKSRVHPTQAVNYPNIALYSVKRPSARLQSYPQVDPGYPRVQEIYQPQPVLKQQMASIYPIYDQLGPIRAQSHMLPSQYLQQNRIYQFIPVNAAHNYDDAEDNREKSFANQENNQESRLETTERAPAQNEISTPKQGYHAHPNGAISFASFSQNIPVNTQYENVIQAQSNNIYQTKSENIYPAQPAQIPAQHRPVAIQQPQNKLITVKQRFQYPQGFQYPQMFHKVIQEPEKYGQPDFPPLPQLIAYKQHIPNHADVVNELPQQIIYQNPQQVSNGQIIQIPAFKPLPPSVLTAESYFPQTSSPSPKDAEPRPFNYDEQSTPQPANHINQPIAPVLPQRQHTPLPPLKPNYSKFVKPLKPSAHTTSIFLPTTLQPIPTTTEIAQPFADQLVSSTTVRPELNNQDDSKEDIAHLKIDSESHRPQPLEHEKIPQSLPVLPLTRSTTYTPSYLHSEYSTPQPVYQATERPNQSVETPARHDVVIQKQEIQELFFDAQPSSTPQYPQQEREEHQLQSQVHHQIFEQLQPPLYQQELHELHSQQYRHAPQSGSPQHQYVSQQVQPQQYVILQQAHPLQRHQVNPDQLQNQLSTEQSQEQQQRAEQTQSQSEQYQQNNLEPKNLIQVTTANPPEEYNQTSSPADIQHQSDSQVQQQTKPQQPTGKPEEQPEKESHPGISLLAYQGPVISRIQTLYAQPQQLVPQPEYSMVDVPMYPDVQYFGKFAEALFANLQH